MTTMLKRIRILSHLYITHSNSVDFSGIQNKAALALLTSLLKQLLLLTNKILINLENRILRLHTST